MSNLDTTRVMGAGPPAEDRTLVVPGGAQATMMMPGQADAARTQMGGTIACPICNSTTPLMDAYCGDCGFLLASTPSEAAEVPVNEPPAAELVDTQSGRRFRLRSGLNTLGRQGTDILVNEGTVSRNHANITVQDGVVTIEDLGSSNGTKVGGQRLAPNQPVVAASGTELRFGNWNVTLDSGSTQPGSAAATIAMPAGAADSDKTLASSAFSDEDTFVASTLVAPEAQTPILSAVDPIAGGALVGTLRRIDGSGDDIAVTEGVISIGRRPENTVVLTGDAYSSGRHAEIVTDPTGTYVADLGSTNGTIVNGAKIAAHERIQISFGDEIHIGQSKFRFEGGDAGRAEEAESDAQALWDSTADSGRA